MLSTNHPYLLPDLRQLRYGVMPVKWPDGTVALVLKVTKETILAARLRGELKVYLFSDPGQSDRHLGIVTASFDDHEEPLTVVTALFDGDELLADVTAALSQAEFDAYFFDEHDRELMGVRVCNADASRFRGEVAAAAFAPFDLETYGALAERLAQRFAIRDATDDLAAFTLTLGERLYPDDLVLYDTRPEAYAFRDAHQHPAISGLVREDPGPPQERDIAVMLGRVFPAESIYLNPFRADTGKELSDVMVVTEKMMLFIETKDSPNTAASLGRTMDRKRLTIQNQIEKATKQLKRALVYARETDGVVIAGRPEPTAVPLAGRQLLGLIVVREMFDHDQVANSEPVLAMVDELQLPIMLIDYPGLHVVSQNLRTPARFLNALHDLFDMALEHGQFPRSVWNGPPLEG